MPFKGSPEIVEQLQKLIEIYDVKEHIQLVGSFCTFIHIAS